MNVFILGRSEIENLRIMNLSVNQYNSVINSENVTESQVKIKVQFCTIFYCMAKLKGGMEIKLKENPKPFDQLIPRVVPVSFMERIKKVRGYQASTRVVPKGNSI